MAWFRLIMAIHWSIYLVIVLCVEPKALVVHLTFWGIQLMTYSYICLSISHIKNGDICCSRQKSSPDPEPTSPWRLWKLSTLLFQFALAFGWSITFFYWGVLFPLVKFTGAEYMDEY